jgi:tRNA A-37 threonylcarbamoyl transferase component Bud32
MRRIQARITTPSEVMTSDAHRMLPDDLLRQASGRFRLICLIGIGLWAANLLVFHVVATALGWMSRDQVDSGQIDIAAGFLIGISALLWYFSRNYRGDPRRILNVGLFYQVVTCAAIAYVNHWAIQSPGDEHGVSWVAIIILIFPAVMPTVPRYTAIAAVVSAAMDPVMYLAWLGDQGQLQPLGSVVATAFFLHAPNFLCAGVAIVISHIITGLGRQVVKARELGSYELGELLGSGGMGEVWRANHRLLARPAAIKLIRPERLGCSDSRTTMVVQERFKREARAAASLRSPHTIDLFDFGVSSDGTFYYVMELLAGFDLDQLVRRFGPLDPARVVHIMRQACDSLGEAHTRGLVHRDIKPANIYLCRMGLQHDFVKVLDFGLVKTDNRGTEQTLLTSPEVTTGTPAFMAPEVALSEAVDGRTDLYALGCVGYWLLTGQLVFEADTAIQMAAHHIRTAPIPPSRRSELGVPPALDHIILQCLAKSPADRPATSQELARMLSQVNGTAAWGEDQAARWWATNAPEIQG